jgi:hypothetical protein
MKYYKYTRKQGTKATPTAKQNSNKTPHTPSAITEPVKQAKSHMLARIL